MKVNHHYVIFANLSKPGQVIVQVELILLFLISLEGSYSAMRTANQ